MLRSATLALLLLLVPAATAQDTIAELDAYWAEVSRTVEEGDFEGYAATYHPDAVLIFAGSNATLPIADGLAGWKSGFDATASGDQKSSVSFRFSRRLNSATTAHEVGIFHYQADGPDGVTDAMVHFTGLLVKKDGRWLMLMEDQEQEATKAEWDALAPGN
jgi:ketosteroid isomerase-like protein